jgi:hypothetical protein
MTMPLLYRIFGWPHELLHVLALRLIGRRAVTVTQTHVDIPGDLSTGQYVFVAGLPALVFWTIALLCLQALFSAPSIVQAILSFVLMSAAALAGFGTVGDILLIIERLSEKRIIPPDDE